MKFSTHLAKKYCELPDLHLQPSNQASVVNKIDDLLHQLFHYIESHEEHFKLQLDEIYLPYWEENKSTEKNFT